jgi:cytochrome c-type biogenesis protein
VTFPAAAGGLEQTVGSGSLLLAVPIAVAAGLVSFLSPCVLPLVPGYLGYVTGMTGVELERQRRGRLVAGTALFVLGFTAVYVVLGVTAGALGSLLARHAEIVARVLGGVTILLGLVFAGAIPVLQGTHRPDVRPAAGLLGAPLLGAVFALGWVPCTGPTLAVILGLAGIGADPARGAVLATAYCLGLGLPFLLAGLAYRRAMGAFAAVRRHRLAVTRAGGALLVVVGLLLVSGQWSPLVARLQGLLPTVTTVI